MKYSFSKLFKLTSFSSYFLKSNFKTIITITNNLNNLKQTEKQIKELLKTNITKKVKINYINNLINNYSNELKPNESERILNELSNYDLKPNIVTYTIIIKGYTKINNLNEANRIFNLMKNDNNIKLNVIAYSTLINAYAQAKKPVEAEKILREMSSNKIEPDIVCYGAVINAYSKANLPEEAERVLREIILTTSLQLNIITYNTLIYAYAQNNRPNESEHILREMYHTNIKPDLTSYSSVINAYCKASQPNHGERILLEMIENGIQPNTAIFNTLIKGYIANNEMAKCKELFDYMKLVASLKPDIVTYNTLLDGYISTNRFEFAEKLVEEMKKQTPPIKLSAITYNTLIKGYGSIPNIEKANEVLNEMILAGYDPDVATYNSILLGYSKTDPIECERYFRKTFFESSHNNNNNNDNRNMKLYPDLNSFRFVINSYGRKQMFNDGERIFNEMLKVIYKKNDNSSIKIGSSVYLLLIDMYYYHKDLENIERIVNSLVESGLVVDTPLIYEKILQLCRDMREKQRGKYWLDKAKKSVGARDFTKLEKLYKKISFSIE